MQRIFTVVIEREVFKAPESGVTPPVPCGRSVMKPGLRATSGPHCGGSAGRESTS